MHCTVQECNLWFLCIKSILITACTLCMVSEDDGVVLVFSRHAAS